MTSLPGDTPKKLGLVIDLDTCVGCQACVTSCKEWNTGGYSAPLSDHDPYGADPSGAFLNRVHSFEMEIDGRGARCISRAPACIARNQTASPSAPPEPVTSAPRTGSFWSTRTPASAASCVPGPAPTVRGNTTMMTAS
jgi:ferredoxin